MRRIATAVATLALVAGASVGLATSASASDVSCASVVGSGTASTYRYITVKNSCGSAITVKLDINNANDSGCFSIAPYSAEDLRYNRLFGNFRAIIDC